MKKKEEKIAQQLYRGDIRFTSHGFIPRPDVMGWKACVHASFKIWKLEIVLGYLNSVCIVVDKFGYPRISNFWNIVSSY